MKKSKDAGTYNIYIDYLDVVNIVEETIEWIEKINVEYIPAANMIREDLLCALKQTAEYDAIPKGYGRWKFHEDGSAACSECGYHQADIWNMDGWQNYCGVCGADMREYVGKDADGNLIKNPRLRNE